MTSAMKVISKLYVILAGTLYCESFYFYGTLCFCKQGQTVVSVNGTTCADTNECAVDNGGCEHRCTNTRGSFTCSCDPGYKLQSDGQGCEDIDECSEAQHSCEGGCVNTPGGYYCSCHEHRQLAQSDVTVYDSLADVSRCEGYPRNHISAYECKNANTYFGIQTCTCRDSITRTPRPVPGTGGCLGKSLTLTPVFYTPSLMYLSDKVAAFLPQS